MTGFIQDRSSIDNVKDLVTRVEDQTLRGKITISVFHDVQGAFDNLTHSGVFQGLKTIVIRGSLYHWIMNYLNNKTIFMRRKGGDTRQHLLKKGVPKGGVSCPVLFNVALIGISEVV